MIIRAIINFLLFSIFQRFIHGKLFGGLKFHYNEVRLKWKDEQGLSDLADSRNRSITFSVVALIRRNDQRGDNSWQEICRVESRRNCINLSSLSRAGARQRRSVSIARLNLPSRRNRLRFALHYFHIISHPRHLPRWRRRSGPGHMAGCSPGEHRKTQRDSQ